MFWKWEKIPATLHFVVKTVFIRKKFPDEFEMCWARGDHAGSSQRLVSDDAGVLHFEETFSCPSTIYMSKKDHSVRPKNLKFILKRYTSATEHKVFGKLSIDVGQYYIAKQATTVEVEMESGRSNPPVVTIVFSYKPITNQQPDLQPNEDDMSFIGDTPEKPINLEEWDQTDYGSEYETKPQEKQHTHASAKQEESAAVDAFADKKKKNHQNGDKKKKKHKHKKSKTLDGDNSDGEKKARITKQTSLTDFAQNAKDILSDSKSDQNLSKETDIKNKEDKSAAKNEPPVQNVAPKDPYKNEEDQKKEAPIVNVSIEVNGQEDIKKAEKPKKEEIIPKKEEVTPKREEIIPKKEEVIPKKEEVTPKKEEIIPKKEEIIPKKEEIIPNKEEIIPNKEEVIPNKEEVIPNKEEVAQKEIPKNEDIKKGVPKHEANMKDHQRRDAIMIDPQESKSIIQPDTVPRVQIDVTKKVSKETKKQLQELGKKSKNARKLREEENTDDQGAQQITNEKPAKALDNKSYQEIIEEALNRPWPEYQSDAFLDRSQKVKVAPAVLPLCSVMLHCKVLEEKGSLETFLKFLETAPFNERCTHQQKFMTHLLLLLCASTSNLVLSKEYVKLATPMVNSAFRDFLNPNLVLFEVILNRFSTARFDVDILIHDFNQVLPSARSQLQAVLPPAVSRAASRALILLIDAKATAKILANPARFCFTNGARWASFCTALETTIGVSFTITIQVAHCLMMGTQMAHDTSMRNEICPQLTDSTALFIMANTKPDEMMPLPIDSSGFAKSCGLRPDTPADTYEIDTFCDFTTLAEGMSVDAWRKCQEDDLILEMYPFINEYSQMC